MKAVLWSLTVIIASALLAARGAQAADKYEIQPDVVYGHKDGLALTFDVVKPKVQNGAGILFLQSGGWYSRWTEPKKLLPLYGAFLNRGYTVFIVRHGSAPKYAVPDAVDDVRRSVRYIRRNAGEFGVDANRLGAVGSSAGGHLTLVLATTGDDGDEDAKEELLQESSRIAAGIALCPPTDLRTWTTDPPEAIKKIPGLKPPLTFDAEKEDDFSPVLHVSSDDAPVLLLHGDKDELVPIAHSQNMIKAIEEEGATGELFVIEGAGHAIGGGNPGVGQKMLGWFEKHLAKK